jgi:hypothetical protein
MNFATDDGGVLQSIGRWVKDSWHRFAKVVVVGGQKVPYAISEVMFRSTLAPKILRPVRLAVMRIDLERS